MRYFRNNNEWNDIEVYSVFFSTIHEHQYFQSSNRGHLKYSSACSTCLLLLSTVCDVFRGSNKKNDRHLGRGRYMRACSIIGYVSNMVPDPLSGLERGLEVSFRLGATKSELEEP